MTEGYKIYSYQHNQQMNRAQPRQILPNHDQINTKINQINQINQRKIPQIITPSCHALIVHIFTIATNDCRRTPRYCSYHHSKTHSTEECRKKPKQEAHTVNETTPEQFTQNTLDWAFACGSSSQNILTYDSACTTHLIKDI